MNVAAHRAGAAVPMVLSAMLASLVARPAHGQEAASTPSTVMRLELQDHEGAPCAGVPLALLPADPTGLGFSPTALRRPLQARADAQGRCVLNVPRFECYWLYVGGVEAPGMAYAVMPAEELQTLTVETSGAMTFRCDPDDRDAGWPLRVLLRRLDREAPVVSAAVDGNELTVDRLRPGHWCASAVIDGHRYTQVVVEVKAGSSVELQVAPPDGELLSGVIVGADGQPVAGARILGSENSLLDVTAGADGSFDLGWVGGMAMKQAIVVAPGSLPQVVQLGAASSPLRVELAASPHDSGDVRLLVDDGREAAAGDLRLLLLLGDRDSLERRIEWPALAGTSRVPAGVPLLAVGRGQAVQWLQPDDQPRHLTLRRGVSRELLLDPENRDGWVLIHGNGGLPRKLPIALGGRVFVGHIEPGTYACLGSSGMHPAQPLVVDTAAFAVLSLR